MDVRNWALNQIMELPDECFGRRFPIILGDENQSDEGTWYHISEIGLPDICVLWHIHVAVDFMALSGVHPYLSFSLALGDQLPTTAAQFLAMESMFPESDEIVGGARVVHPPLNLPLRKPYAAQGRRVVVRETAVSASPYQFTLALVFSSIPREVPDCLLPGTVRSL